MRNALLALAVAASALHAGPRPKVRAITAFIDVDSQNYSHQIEEAVQFLNAAREAYRSAGWDVETIRIATQPFPQYTKGLSHDDALAVLRGIDALGTKFSFMPSIGPAMWNDNDSTAPVDLLIDFLSQPSHANASLITAAQDGIHWNAIRQAARLIDTVSRRSVHGQGNLNFAAIAMLKPYGPFFPGAYHPGGSRAFAVGVEGASVVADVFAQEHEPRAAESKLAEALTAQLGAVEKIAIEVSSVKGWNYAGLDPTPAPLGQVSIARAIESFTGAPFGSSGTMTAAAVITRAVQSVAVRRVGYSGLMLPVLEDSELIKRWDEGAVSMDALLAYSAVCAGGLDTIPLAGDTGEDRLAHILSDVATLAYKWQKPLAARLLPAPGRKAGERTEFDDARMANALIH